jgi:hypothetical protein
MESILVWLINLIDPTFFHADSFSSFSAFPVPTSPPAVVMDFYWLMLVTRSISMMVVLGAA